MKFGPQLKLIDNKKICWELLKKFKQRFNAKCKSRFQKKLPTEFFRVDHLTVWKAKTLKPSMWSEYARSKKLEFFRGGVCFINPPPLPLLTGRLGIKRPIIMIMIFHKYLWLVWYEGMIVETNGDHIPGAIQSLMEEYFIVLSLGHYFQK